MKSVLYVLFFVVVMASCTSTTGDSAATESTENVALTGQEGVKDDESQKDVVKVAIASPDHTTLVTAVTAADLVTSLSNAGPALAGTGLSLLRSVARI